MSNKTSAPTLKQRLAQSQADRARNARLSRQMPSGKVGRLKGRGGYFSDMMKKVFKEGDFAKAGNWLGNSIAKITGFGDYQINKNSIIENMPVNAEGQLEKRFSFSSTGTANIRVKKREYLGSITAAAVNPEAFSLLAYRLQPCNAQTFPWLSNIGQLFSEWRLIGCVVTYESTSSNYSATMGLGTVAIATQYNANMLPYADMDSILGASYFSKGNPSEDVLHGIECDPRLQMSERLQTRRPTADGPPNLYDHGVVYFATEGLPPGAAGVTLGRLYITYDIELSLPELPVRAPYAELTGVTYQSNVLTTQPPFGPTLTLTQDPISQMTISTTAGANILLLQPASGPLVKPDLSPEDTNEICAWLNDSSGIGTQTFLSFARAGTYVMTVDFSSVAGSDFVAADFTTSAHSNATVNTIFRGIVVGATDNAATWVSHINVTEASGSIVLNNGHSGTHFALVTLEPC